MQCSAFQLGQLACVSAGSMSRRNQRRLSFGAAFDEAEWYVDIGAKTGGSTLENTWGLTFGQFDEDEAMEVAVGSKQGWIAVFDGETEELQWKYDMDGSSGADSLCYSLLSADLDGDDIDELIVPQQNKLTVFVLDKSTKSIKVLLSENTYHL